MKRLYILRAASISLILFITACSSFSSKGIGIKPQFRVPIIEEKPLVVQDYLVVIDGIKADVSVKESNEGPLVHAEDLKTSLNIISKKTISLPVTFNENAYIKYNSLDSAFNIRSSYHPIRKVIHYSTGAVLEEKNGLIVGNIALAAFSESWIPKSSLTQSDAFNDHYGPVYYVWEDDNRLNKPFPKDTFALLEYKVWIHEGGAYHFCVRNRHDYHDITIDNDLWLSIDKSDYVKASAHTIGKFVWELQQQSGIIGPDGHDMRVDPLYELSPGLHIIKIMPRSKNFALDQFVLTKDFNAFLNIEPVTQSTFKSY